MPTSMIQSSLVGPPAHITKLVTTGFPLSLAFGKLMHHIAPHTEVVVVFVLSVLLCSLRRLGGWVGSQECCFHIPPENRTQVMALNKTRIYFSLNREDAFPESGIIFESELPMETGMLFLDPPPENNKQVL